MLRSLLLNLGVNALKACPSAGGVILNGAPIENENKSLGNILSMSVIGLKSEILQRVLADNDGILIGTGSACAASKTGNRVLSAAGKSKKETRAKKRPKAGRRPKLHAMHTLPLLGKR